MTTIPWPPTAPVHDPDADPPTGFLTGARAFPAPAGVLAGLFALWQSPPDPEQVADDSVDRSLLSAPWDPAALPAEALPDLYRWLNQVVGHLNWTYGHSPSRTIPACWDRHPHLVALLSALAAQRLQAFAAIPAQPASDWTFITLAAFYRELNDEQPATDCRQVGQHRS